MTVIVNEYFIPGSSFMCDGKFYVADSDGKFKEVFDGKFVETNNLSLPISLPLYDD